MRLLIFFAAAAFALAQHDHKAHDHSSASLDVAIEGKKVTVEFESPADPIVGFEHEAKTPADKAKLSAALAKLRAASLIVMPASAACKVGSSDAAFAKHGDHAEITAKYELTCANNPLQGSATFRVSALYPELTQLKVQAVTGTGAQSGVTIKNGQGRLDLAALAK
jgi:hypothetical protein